MSDHDPRHVQPGPPASSITSPSALTLTDDAIASLASTAVNLARFTPDVSDPEALAILVDVVAESARANESISQLKERLTQVGDRVVTVAREVANVL